MAVGKDNDAGFHTAKHSEKRAIAATIFTDNYNFRI